MRAPERLIENATARADIACESGGIADYEHVVGHVIRHDGPRTDHGVLAYGQAA
jgi:hypothetical protein